MLDCSKVTTMIVLSLLKAVNYWGSIDVGRAAPFASPIRFESLGLLHDPFTLPAGSSIDP